MIFPASYEEIIKSRGIPLSAINPGSHEVALSKASALKAIETLKGSMIAILGGDVLRNFNGRLEYIYENWSCTRHLDEDYKNFADRSRAEAISYIRKFEDDEGALFVFVVADS